MVPRSVVVASLAASLLSAPVAAAPPAAEASAPAPSAEETLKQRVAAFERGGEPSDPAYIQALGALARFHVNNARYAEALPVLRRALTASERIHGPKHPVTDEVRTTVLVAEAFVGRK